MTRRIVVAAPYPTMPGPEAASTFSLVRRLVAEGNEVLVVSPDPSAAHHHADPGGPRGAARLARLAAGADLLHLRIDASSLGASLDAPRLLPARLALHVLVRRARETEVRVDRVPEDVSAAWASLVLGKAARVLVDDEAAREALVRAGIDAARIRVVSEAPASPPVLRARPRAGAPVATLETAEALQELVRARAAEHRSTVRRSAVAEGTAARPLRHLARIERAPVRSNKPGGAFLKKAIAKVLQWQFDNVIASVNRLHQATIDAIENLEAERTQAGDDTTR